MKIRYVSWRDDGRPRFIPGRTLRALGHSSRVLRHPDGRWFSMEEVAAFIQQVEDGLVVKRVQAVEARRVLAPAAPKRLTNEEGFVYFLRSGERIKIGFSKRPWMRLGQLMTGLSHGVTMMAYVPGTQREERRAHWFLGRYRQSGEWFDYHPNVVKVVMRSITFGKVTLDESGDRNGVETNLSHVRHSIGNTEDDTSPN